MEKNKKDTIGNMGSREYLKYNTLKDVDKAISLLYDKFYNHRLAKPYGSK